jgi:hypothetical protein
MWKVGDLERRTRRASVEQERRWRLQASWKERERTREIAQIRDAHHDAHAKTIAAPPRKPR